jgi:hypothetical protein
MLKVRLRISCNWGSHNAADIYTNHIQTEQAKLLVKEATYQCWLEKHTSMFTCKQWIKHWIIQAIDHNKPCNSLHCC